MIRSFLIIFLLLFISCSKPAINITTCDGINKVSTEYVKCLENLINSSNTATNIKEFGKHKTGLSFFKRVTVEPSD